LLSAAVAVVCVAVEVDPWPKPPFPNPPLAPLLGRLDPPDVPELDEPEPELDEPEPELPELELPEFEEPDWLFDELDECGSTDEMLLVTAGRVIIKPAPTRADARAITPVDTLRRRGVCPCCGCPPWPGWPPEPDRPYVVCPKAG